MKKACLCFFFNFYGSEALSQTTHHFPPLFCYSQTIILHLIANKGALNKNNNEKQTLKHSFDGL